jgi:hypothetical protein
VSDEQLVSFWSKVFFQSLLSILVIVFLNRLNGLNNRLREKVDLTDSFDVAMFNNGEPCLFVLFALVLVIIAVVLVIWCWRATINEDLTRFTVLTVLALLLNFIYVVLIWHMINNPILRAVIIVLVAGIVMLYCFADA